MIGTVKNVDRGFFFLEADNCDYFAHKDDLPPEIEFEQLRSGQQFHFDPIPDAPRGPRAANLTYIFQNVH